ncbi:MAG: hypothetical protein AUK35_08380 [Zetaproteobacteria bacterium CG2_30_46_52]|nr:MAG: hypothetical protein AUK35_08380 [Zetaproteobacteria bacterium CG2_30_46_52]
MKKTTIKPWLPLAIIAAFAITGCSQDASDQEQATQATSTNKSSSAQLSSPEPLAPTVTTPDFASIKDVKAKKKAFFDFMRPIVLAENAKVAYERTRMLALYDAVNQGETINAVDQAWLKKLAETYRVSMTNINDNEAWSLLKLRVDTVPFRLALAQSANESSWGTSRFAKEGKNFFGQWCFSKGCGIIPSQRSAGLVHEVAKFASVNESVASYIRNLNRGDMYKQLRLVRQAMRDDEKEPTAHALAAGLIGYSERKQAYVDEIRSMIKYNFDLMAGTTPVKK